MKKRIGLYSLLIFILLLIVTGTVMLTTETGLRLTVALTNKVMAGELHIGQVSGRLISHVQAKKIHYKSKNLTIAIDQTNLAWKPLQLFARRLTITKCHINGVYITLKHHAETQTTETKQKEVINERTITQFISASGLPKINIPLEVIVQDVDIKHVVYQHQTKNPIDIHSLKLKIHHKNNQLNIQEFDLKTKNYDMNLVGNILLNYPVETNLKAKIIYHLPEHKAITTQLSIVGNLKEKIILSLLINDPFQTAINATIHEAVKQGPIDASGKWENLLIPISTSNIIQSKQGQFSIVGTLKKYIIKIDSDFKNKQILKSNWHIEGTGTLDSVNLTKIQTTLKKGELSGRLQLAWYPHLSWKSIITAKDFNPGLEWPKWKGDVNFTLHSDGKLNGQQTYFNILLDNVSGTIHKHPLKGHFKAHYANQEFNITKSSLTIGDDFLRISGKLGKIWDFNWSIKAPNIAEAFIDASGSMIGAGHIKGPNKTPYIKGKVALNKFLFKRIYVKKLSTNFDIDFRPHGKSFMQLTGNEILLADFLINRIQFNLTGHINHHKVTTNIQTKNSNTNISIVGHYQNETWNETITKIDQQSKLYQTWHLKNAVPIKLTGNHLIIAPFYWQSKDAELSGQVDWQHNQKSLLQFDAKNIPSKMFTALFPNDTNIISTLKMHARLTGDKENRLNGNIDLSTNGGDIQYLAAKIKPIHFGKSFLKMIFNKKGLNAQLKINNTTRTPVNINLLLPEYYGNSFPQASQKIQGKIDIHFLRLVLLPTIIPHITNANGEFLANLDLGGKIDKPTLIGQAEIRNGVISNDELNTQLDHINIVAKTDPNGSVSVQGIAKSNNNEVKISGESSLRYRFKHATLKISGSNILVINTDEYHIFLSPDITLTYNRPNLMIRGSLLVPKALLTPTTFGTITTLPSNVIIETGEKQEELSPLLNVYRDIKCTLGNEVGIEYEGLVAKIAGSIDVKTAPNALATAVGSLHVTRGFYDTHGKRLNISRGRFMFTGGPLNNPGINVRASKQVTRSGGESMTSRRGTPTSFSPALGTSDFTVGVQLLGRLQDPRISLFSEPAGLSDSDILSFLVLGSSANSASADAIPLLLEAANFLGTNKDKVSADIKQKHGLNELGLSRQGKKGGEQTSFTVGKKVSPKVQMNYGVGLLSPLNILNVKYNLSDRFKIRTEASTRDTSVDVFYSFETD